MSEIRAPSFRLYIDESGDHTFKEIDKTEKRYLGLTGCIINNEHYRTIFQPELEKIKQKHFPHSPDDPLIFHRKEIMNRQGKFWRLRDQKAEENFNKDLLDFLGNMQYTLITVVIDKKSHVDRYKESAFHPYHYCLAALMERYCGFLRFHNTKGDVLAEGRGGQEDFQLKNAYKRIYDSGTLFRPADFFQQTLTSKEIKIKLKSANIAGTQIADLLAHPIKQEILLEKKILNTYEDKFGPKICERIRGKHNRRFRSDKVDGYGKVFLV